MSIASRLIVLAIATAGVSVPQAVSAADSPVLEEIIVTAERRERNLRKVPIAVSAFDEDAIAVSDLDGIESLQTHVPGLVWGEFGGNAQVTLRGIGVDIPSVSSEPGVALNVDNIYSPRISSFQALFSDLERIEVLRGPQGTLFGRNTTGGAINMITKVPGNEFEGNVSALAGDEGHYRVRGGVTIPLIENQLSTRISVAGEDFDGYNKNLLTGDTDKREHRFARAVLNWTPNDQFSWVTRVMWSDDEWDGPINTLGADLNDFVPFPVANVYVQGAVPPDDIREFNHNAANAQNSESTSVNTVLEWDFGPVVLKSATSYTDYEYELLQDIDGSEFPLLAYDRNSDESETFFQELIMTSDNDSNLTWVAGVNYYNDDMESANDDLPLIDPNIGVLALRFDYAQETEAWAVFGQATYDLTDRVRGTVGLRYSDEEKKISQTVTTKFPFPVAFGALIGLPLEPNDTEGSGLVSTDPALGSALVSCDGLESTRSFDELTPKFGIDFDLNDEVMVYASATKGYKAGGISNAACRDEYEAEKVWVYEAGFKSQLLENRLRLNMLAFYTEFDNYQANLLVQGSGEIRNIPESDVFGVEAELTALLGDYLTIDAGFSYLDAESGSFDTEDPIFLNQLDIDGVQLPRSPETSFFINASLDWPLGSFGDGTLRYEFSWSDEYYFGIFNWPFDRQESFDVHNARLVLRPAAVDGLAVHLFVNNLTDEEYRQGNIAALLPGNALIQWAAPRNWGVEVTLEF